MVTSHFKAFHSCNAAGTRKNGHISNPANQNDNCRSSTFRRPPALESRLQISRYLVLASEATGESIWNKVNKSPIVTSPLKVAKHKNMFNKKKN